MPPASRKPGKANSENPNYGKALKPILRQVGQPLSLGLAAVVSG